MPFGQRLAVEGRVGGDQLGTRCGLLAVEQVAAVVEHVAPGVGPVYIARCCRARVTECLPPVVDDVDARAVPVGPEGDLDAPGGPSPRPGCQASTSRDGGSHARTSAHTAVRPSVAVSTSVPSRKATVADSAPNRPWVRSGHHAPMPAVKRVKASEGARRTVALRRTGGSPLAGDATGALLGSWEVVVLIGSSSWFGRLRGRWARTGARTGGFGVLGVLGVLDEGGEDVVPEAVDEGPHDGHAVEVDPVEATGAIGAVGHEAGLLQHLQVLRHPPVD